MSIEFEFEEWVALLALVIGRKTKLEDELKKEYNSLYAYQLRQMESIYAKLVKHIHPSSN